MKKIFNLIKQHLPNTSTKCLMFASIGIFLAFYTNCNPSVPEGIERTVISKANIDMRYLGDDKMIYPGETVEILGQYAVSTNNIMLFWVTTENGDRGLIPQEAVDNRGILYDIDDDSDLPYKDGDEVKILRRIEDTYCKFEIQTEDGNRYEISYDKLITVTGNELLEYNLNGRRGNILSKSKFERLYLGESFEDAEEIYREAFYVKKTRNSIEAAYELFVYDPNDSKQYRPIVKFENNVAVSYTLEKYKDENSFVLGFLPLVEPIIDFGLFANLIKGNTYTESTLGDSDKNIILIILLFIPMGIMVILFVIWVALTNQIISFLLCGSLSFRYPLKILNNRAVFTLLAITSYLFTYVWIVLMLCYGYHWWYFIPILLYVNYKVVCRFKDFLITFPNNRCPKCKSLCTIFHNRVDLMGNYQQWRSSTEKGKLLDSRTLNWTSHDIEVKTETYSDGSKKVSERKVNQQNHSRTIDTHQYNEYNILYHVYDFHKVYKCEVCEHEEYSEYEELVELDRKLLNVYAE